MSQRGSRSRKSFDFDNDVVAEPKIAPPDLSIPLFDHVNVRQTVRTVSEATYPSMSFMFLALFLATSYFHETHFVYVGPFLLSWCILQLLNIVTEDEFHQHNLFWNFMALLGNIVLYLVIGYGWSLLKLYIDVWQGHFDPMLMEVMRTCIQSDTPLSCIPGVLLELKWFIMRSMVTWPVSVIYTLCRDPLNIFTEVVFEWSKKRYVYIITLALSNLDNTSNTSKEIHLLYWGLYVIEYFVVGYLWTHVKLFLEVWKGTLPPSLDQEVRDVYARKTSYWDFVVHIKWLVLQWMFTWPMSILFTLFQHPFRIVADFIYTISTRKYMWIVGQAMELRNSKQE